MNNTIPGDGQLFAQILRDLNKQDPNVERIGCIVLKYITCARQLKGWRTQPEVRGPCTSDYAAPDRKAFLLEMREESGQCLEAPRTKPLRPR